MSAEPLRALEGGRTPSGWEALWALDTWHQTQLPHGDLTLTARQAVLHFDGLQQPWLKEAAKRWARVRLLGETTPRTLSAYLFALRHFSRWLAERAPEVSAPSALSREVLEDYLRSVRSEPGLSATTRSRRIIALRALLDEQAEDGLVGLPRAAMIHRGEIPRAQYRLPKGLQAEVFEQIVDSANLARLESEMHRTVVLLLAYTGFRVSSVITLARDSRQFGPDGQPYLAYWNVKAKREAMLPIPSVLSEQLDRHEAFLAERYPQGTEWLLPSPPIGERRGKGGRFHLSPSAVGEIVKRYVRRAEIRTPGGKLALELHPHLFRHNLATSLVNDEIPLTVIQQVLDHGSMEMTAHYARLHDQTVKRAVERWHERVNIRGERIALPTEGPLEQAAWMKERIARAKQALPNGYCGLPLQQSCPHPNACLSCGSFLTDGSFRSVHEQQQAQTRRLLDNARQNNNVRLIELLERDEQSLSRILEGLDAIDAEPADGDELLDLRDRARPANTEEDG